MDKTIRIAHPLLPGVDIVLGVVQQPWAQEAYFKLVPSTEDSRAISMHSPDVVKVDLAELHERYA